MKTTTEIQTPEKRITNILTELKAQGRLQGWLACQIEVSPQYFNMILKGVKAPKNIDKILTAAEEKLNIN